MGFATTVVTRNRECMVSSTIAAFIRRLTSQVLPWVQPPPPMESTTLAEIVGGYCPPNSPNCPNGVFLPPIHGYLDDHGAFTTLDYPGAEVTGASVINNAGTIVGTYDIDLTGPHAFLYQNGVYTNIVGSQRQLYRRHGHRQPGHRRGVLLGHQWLYTRLRIPKWHVHHDQCEGCV